MKPKMFTAGAIIEMIIAVFCIAGGSFIIIFNIIIYPKFNSLVYSVIALFALVIVLLIIAAHIYVKYKNYSDNAKFEEYIANSILQDDTIEEDTSDKDKLI
ncbi:MAG: hypothetical protein EOM87_05495 [Clostridia bacterium]|nr:hypothetical protein [Clostridia bacterium]